MTQTPSNENIQQELFRAQEQFWAALQSKDRKAFERLLADDFVGRSPGQSNQDRTAFIDTLTGFPVQVRSVGSDNLEVHVFGTVAVDRNASGATGTGEWANEGKQNCHHEHFSAASRTLASKISSCSSIGLVRCKCKDRFAYPFSISAFFIHSFINNLSCCQFCKGCGCTYVRDTKS